MSINNIFGVHEQALLLREQRFSVLANNLTNASTPGYKARDIDFNDAMKSISQNSLSTHVSLNATNEKHISLQNGFTHVPLKYRIPHLPAVDGNTVDLDIERQKFAENATKYQATLTFIKNRTGGLISAIKGE